MSSPSPILNGLTYSEKKSLAGLIAVALPADDLEDGQWNSTLLEDVLGFLDLDKELALGFYPLTECARQSLPRTSSVSIVKEWQERVSPFRSGLPPKGEGRLVALRDLMVIVSLHCGYDARTRILFRRVCNAMEIDWQPRVVEVESTLARKVYERVTRERERELKVDRWRGFKIGAAMIGGGALLAVSGGLAAPAVAAGIAASGSLIGASAAATLSGFATTAWMATVFGATGAGLVGYKMDRRTKGVQEFEFESETSVGQEMCVSICVPGVLKDKADLQRGWGVEPRGPDVSATERLRRYYYVYNREKVGNVEEILKMYKGKEASLCGRLATRYGADPRDPPTREALAKAEGRTVEGVAKEDVSRDAAAIGELIETVLSHEKEAAAKEAAKLAAAEKKASKERAKARSRSPVEKVRGIMAASSSPARNTRVERSNQTRACAAQKAPPAEPHGNATGDLLDLLSEEANTPAADDAGSARATPAGASLNADLWNIFSSDSVKADRGDEVGGGGGGVGSECSTGASVESEIAVMPSRGGGNALPSIGKEDRTANASSSADAAVAVKSETIPSTVTLAHGDGTKSTNLAHVAVKPSSADAAAVAVKLEAIVEPPGVDKSTSTENDKDADNRTNKSAVPPSSTKPVVVSVDPETHASGATSVAVRVVPPESTEGGLLRGWKDPDVGVASEGETLTSTVAAGAAMAGTDRGRPLAAKNAPVAAPVVPPDSLEGGLLRGWKDPSTDASDSASSGSTTTASTTSVGSSAGKSAGAMAKTAVNKAKSAVDRAKSMGAAAGARFAEADVRETIEIEAVQEGLDVLSFEASGAAERVAARLEEKTSAAAVALSGDGVAIKWAQSALRRCNGDENLAVDFVEIRTPDEMKALVEADAAEETARKEDEEFEKHRVWFWQDKMPHTDQYVLRWESSMQISLGKSVESVVKSVSSNALQQSLQYTTLATLMTALTWPLALITLANMIDADWTIGRQRADIAGKILADALLNREQGCRPVTLMGTSLGARLIFACLEEIARRHELWEEQTRSGVLDGEGVVGGRKSAERLARVRNAMKRNNNGKSKAGLNGVGVAAGPEANSTSRSSFPKGKNEDAKCAAGIIENVALLGTPLGASTARWERVSRVVHGRLINGYSKSDLILGLVFRAKSLSLNVAGVQKVSAVGVENIDLSTVIMSNHFNYNRRMPEILPMLALDDCSQYICRGDPESDHAPPLERSVSGQELEFADSMF